MENGFVFTEQRYKTIEEAQKNYQIISRIPFNGTIDDSSNRRRWYWILIGYNLECSRVLAPSVQHWPNLDAYKTIFIEEFLKIKDNF